MFPSSVPSVHLNLCSIFLLVSRGLNARSLRGDISCCGDAGCFKAVVMDMSLLWFYEQEYFQGLCCCCLCFSETVLKDGTVWAGTQRGMDRLWCCCHSSAWILQSSQFLGSSAEQVLLWVWLHYQITVFLKHHLGCIWSWRWCPFGTECHYCLEIGKSMLKYHHFMSSPNTSSLKTL